jgi:hypothetical protein
MSSLASFPICAICARPLELETCKVDEFGKAVHEECYLSRVTPHQPKRGDAVAKMTSGNLHRAIVDFLDSASTPSVLGYCHDCGSAVENRNSTFSYRAQTWEISLPICPKCNPVSRFPIFDA